MPTVTYYRPKPFSPAPPPKDPRLLPDWLALLMTQLEESLEPLKAQPADYAFVQGVSLSTGVDNLVAHGLARSATNFIITDINAQSTLWRSTGSTVDATKYIPIRASAACTASLMVF